ncbi:MAG: START domain-containing protein [Pseudomonadota bacterium]
MSRLMLFRKKTNWSHIVLAIAISVISSGGIAADKTWKVLKSADGVEISSRPKSGSPINEIRSTAKIKASLDSVVALLRDYPARPLWDSMCGEVKVLKQGTASETVYVHTEIPWPVTDRDLVMRVEWKQDPTTGVVSMHAVGAPDAEPLRKDRVRMASFTNDWTLTPMDGGIIAVESIAHADPGGPMPTFMINKLSADAPLEAMKKIKSIAANGHNAKSATAFMTKH